VPRYRKLHVKTVESHDVDDMPDDFTRLLWVLLPLGLCQEGRGVDNVGWIKGKVFPMRFDVTPEMIEGAMCWFADRDMIQRYEVEGRSYFCIPNETWHKYQGVTVREANTEYPPPPDWAPPDSGPTPDPVTTGSRSDSSSHADSSTASSADADASSSGEPASAPVDNSLPESPVDDDASLLSDLIAAGMTDRGARAVLEKHDPDRARAWMAFVRGNGKIQNPGGYLWKMLVDGDEDAPPPPRAPPGVDSKEARRRYVSGEYGDVVQH